MALPNPGMDFVPFDILTAEELDDVVENIEALAAGTGLNDASVTAAKLATPPSRFVALAVPVEVANVDPANTSWVSLDITASTSATATAALINVGLTSTTTAGRTAYLRPTGGGAAQDNTTLAVVGLVTTGPKVWNMVSVKLDASQSFDYSVSAADVSALTLVVKGYWETVA